MINQPLAWFCAASNPRRRTYLERKAQSSVVGRQPNDEQTPWCFGEVRQCSLRSARQKLPWLTVAALDTRIRRSPLILLPKLARYKTCSNSILLKATFLHVLSRCFGATQTTRSFSLTPAAMSNGANEGQTVRVRIL